MGKKKKFYAVRKGLRTGLYDTWEACEQAVKGYSGAEFKSFASLEEAKAYLTEAGVDPVHISVSACCTMEQADLFYSHRRMGNRRGNMAAFLMLKSS